MSSSCTEAPCATTARSAASSTTCPTSSIRRACRAAPAAGASSPTWCSTKRAWTKRHSIARWSTFRRPTCSSSRARRSRSIPRRGLCATIADTSLSSSIRRLLTAALAQIWSSSERWEKRSRRSDRKAPEKFGKTVVFRCFLYDEFFYFFLQKKVDIRPLLGL